MVGDMHVKEFQDFIYTFCKQMLSYLLGHKKLFHLFEMDSYEDFISIAWRSVCEEKCWGHA